MTSRISLFAIAPSLLAAHFFRVSNFLLVALSLATPLLFLYKSRWSLIVLQFAGYCEMQLGWGWRLRSSNFASSLAGRGLSAPSF